jgi:hypothetical protein
MLAREWVRVGCSCGKGKSKVRRGVYMKFLFPVSQAGITLSTELTPGGGGGGVALKVI